MLPSPLSHNGVDQSSPFAAMGACAKRAGARWHPYAQHGSAIARSLQSPARFEATHATQPKAKLARGLQRSQSQLISPPRSNTSLGSNISAFPSAASTPASQQGCSRIGTQFTSSQEHCQLNREKTWVAERNHYATGLVESAIALISEIWNLPFEPQPQPQPQPEPRLAAPVQMLQRSQSSITLSQASAKAAYLAPSIHSQSFVGYPLTPTSLPSASPQAALSPAVSTTGSRSRLQTQPCQAAQAQPSGMRHFVHEVLRRSRTSCSTLEVGMCYISAARPLIVQLQAHLHIARTGIAQDFTTLTPLEQLIQTSSGCLQKDLATHPLLDARRAFLSAMVLAGKFLQDKAYSNKAWAKLSGLDAKEITRCERSLGDALGWRLWVGKTTSPDVQGTRDPVANSFICAALAAERNAGHTNTNGTAKIVSRTQSDGGLFADRKQEIAAYNALGIGISAPSTGSGMFTSIHDTPLDDDMTLLNTVTTATPFSIADFIDFGQCEKLQSWDACMEVPPIGCSLPMSMTDEMEVECGLLLKERPSLSKDLLLKETMTPAAIAPRSLSFDARSSSFVRSVLPHRLGFEQNGPGAARPVPSRAAGSITIPSSRGSRALLHAYENVGGNGLWGHGSKLHLPPPPPLSANAAAALAAAPFDLSLQAYAQA